MKTALEWKKYYSSPEFGNIIYMRKNDLGVNCTDSGTSFKLWSPSADSVTLNLYQEGSGCDAYARIDMEKEDKGVWSWSSDKNLHGVYYDYTLMFEGEDGALRGSLCICLWRQRQAEHGGGSEDDGSGKLGKTTVRLKKGRSRSSMSFI